MNSQVAVLSVGVVILHDCRLIVNEELEGPTGDVCYRRRLFSLSTTNQLAEENWGEEDETLFDGAISCLSPCGNFAFFYD